MNARFFKTILILMVLGGGLLTLWQPHRASAQADSDGPALDLFENRALKPHPQDPAQVALLENSPIAAKYYQIVPQRSILIYECRIESVWCRDVNLSLGKMFEESALIASRPRTDGAKLEANWYALAGSKDMDPLLANHLPVFSPDKFQLLAVANRMDLAHLSQNGRWQGGEVHLVYGVIPSPGISLPVDLMLIMEFRIPDHGRTEYQNVAKAWESLSPVDETAQPAAFADALRNALAASGFSNGAARSSFLRVSSRINHTFTSNNWRLTQLVVDPSSVDAAARSDFAGERLQDQVLEKAEALAPVPYLKLWGVQAIALEPGVFHIPVTDVAVMAGPAQTYQVTGLALGTPQGSCNVSNTRDILGIQQCTWCHGAETKTTFKHIANRLPNESSVPSGFLVGSGVPGSNMKPKLTDLYYRNTAVVWGVHLTYQTWVSQGGAVCDKPVEQTEDRYFHDVARRTLFMAAILTDPVDGGGTQPAKKPKAAKFSTEMVE